MVRIPQITSLETAIKLYYEKMELSNDDIKELFGDVSKTKIHGLKLVAKKKMFEKNVRAWDATKVNTDAAYTAWGLEIDDLEKRFNKLKKLNLMGT